MRNCRASVVAKPEKLSLMGHQRLYFPLLFAFQNQEESRWVVSMVVRFKIVPSRRRIYFAYHSEDSGSSTNQRIGLLL